MPTPNIPLLRKAVEWAEREAARTGGGEWNQMYWARQTNAECGTVYCLAGYVSMLEGWEPVFAGPIGFGGLGLQKAELFQKGEETHPPSHIARKALGLTEDEASSLFMSTPTIAQVVRSRCEAIAGEPL